MKKELVKKSNVAWDYYGQVEGGTGVVGKFTTIGSGDISDELQQIILKAIEEGVTPLVKHTNLEAIEFNPQSKDGSWAIIWYSSDDLQALKRLAKFLVDHNLVRKTKAGRLYNMGFKYDEQTANGEYGENFKPTIAFKDLLNLETGEVLD